MIKKSITLCVIVALCLPFGLAGPTLAVEKKQPSAGTAPKRTISKAPLTESECTGLGGKIGTSVCPGTGKECITVDSHGVVHRQCITGTIE
jgi:hypothetical protein